MGLSQPNPKHPFQNNVGSLQMDVVIELMEVYAKYYTIRDMEYREEIAEAAQMYRNIKHAMATDLHTVN